jgi:RHS repeat-associated protein
MRFGRIPKSLLVGLVLLEGWMWMRSNHRLVRFHAITNHATDGTFFGPLAAANLYRFSSKEFHVNSGLVYYLYRFYEPNLQRWPNRDPLGGDGSLVYATAKMEPRTVPRTRSELVGMAAALLDPLSMFTQVSLNLYGAQGNDPVDNIDPFGLDFASCYADCIEHYRNPVGRSISEIGNACLNRVAGGTGRVGIGGKPPHPTTWQHKVGSKFGPVGSKLGKLLGRATIVLTVADGFWDIGLLGGCAAACAGE